MEQAESKLLNWRVAVAVVVLPALVYPCFFLASLVFDTLLGERQMLRRTLVSSRREMWSLLHADWLAALPFCMALGIPLVLIAWWLTVRGDGRRWWIAPLVFCASAAILSLVMMRGQYLEVLLLSAVIYSIVVGGVLRRC